MPDRPIATFHADGSFDVRGADVAILGAYPTIDGVGVRARRGTLAADGLGYRYDLDDGALELRFEDGADGLLLHSRLEGRDRLPRRVCPIGGATVEKADRLYRLGWGIMGGSGVVRFPVDAPVTAYETLAFIAPDDRTLVVSVDDFRRFRTKAVLRPRFEDLSAPQFEFGFSTEGADADGGVTTFPPIRFALGDEPWAAVRREMEHSGQTMAARNRFPVSCHWCSWYYRYYHLDKTTLDAYVRGFAALPDKAGLSAIQIDAGYFPHTGDWLAPSHRFPEGLEPAFATIAEAGFRPGVWIGPFMVGSRSELFRDHPDWMLRRLDGSLLTEWRHYDEERVWGLSDEEHYVLDTSHPDAMEYLRSVFRTFRKWGLRLVKTDFMAWGLVDSTTVRRHTPGKTSVEYFREVCAAIREEIGDDTYWLGCIAPFAPMVGFVDGMRVAADVTSEPGSAAGVVRETVGTQPLNGAWWQNDPDAIVLRARHTGKTPEETRSDAYWFGILGGVVNTSDALHEEPEDRLALWRFLEPGTDGTIATLPRFGHVPVEGERTFGVAVRSYPGRDGQAVLLRNESAHRTVDVLSLKELVGLESATVFRWGPEGAERLGSLTEIRAEAGPRESLLYYVTPSGTPPDGLGLGGRG